MSNPARQARRAARHGHRQPTRMTEYQRNRQAEQPRGEVKVHAHLHGLDLNAAAELDEAGAFEGLPCRTCGQAIEWSPDLDDWQHHATKFVRCAGDRGAASPPDWYAGEEVPELGEDLAADDAPDEIDWAEEAAAEAKPERPAKPPRVDGNPYDTEFARGVMVGLQAKALYQGTVHADEVERRRLRNRDANRARRANRRARVKRGKSGRHNAA
jgi:hypothetical protein